MRINETNHLETYNERTGRVDEVIPRSAHQASIGHRMAAIYGFRNREDWSRGTGDREGEFSLESWQSWSTVTAVDVC